MECLLNARQLQQLSFLGSTSQDQVVGYLGLLQARNYARKTLAAVFEAIRQFLRDLPEPRLEVVKHNLAHTTAGDLDSFVQKATQRGLAPVTINTRLSLLKGFFDFLIEDEQMLSQPIRRHRHWVLAAQTLPKPMAETDVVAFFNVIDSVQNRLLFLLMLRCGLRVSEACTLTWEQIDLEAGTIRINNGKGQVDRVVYVAPDVETTLGRWRAHPSRSRYLFPSQLNPAAPLTPRTAQRWMTRYLQRAGLDRRYTPHCLRHTFATQLLNEGMRLEVLKDLMGHHSIQMTLRYAQLYESTKRRQYNEAMQRIEQRQAQVGR